MATCFSLFLVFGRMCTRCRLGKVLLALVCLFVWAERSTHALIADQVPIPPTQEIEILHGVFDINIQSGTLTVRAQNGQRPVLAIGKRTITADQIEYNPEVQRLYAQGDVRFWNDEQIFRSETLSYNVEEDSGELTQVQQVELSPNTFFQGERVTYRSLSPEEVKGATPGSDFKEYILYNGTMTTNDKPVPYYHIKSSKVRVIPNLRYWAHDLMFLTGGWPLMYFPFYTESLRQHVVTYSFRAGNFSDLGVGLQNKLTIRPNQNYKVQIFGDYFSDIGVGAGGSVDYNVPGKYGPQGFLYGYEVYQEGPDNDRIRDGEDRFLFAGSYAQDLPHGLRLTARGQRFSDSEFRDDFRNPVRQHGIDDDIIEQDRVSHVNLSKAWESQSLRITAAGRLDPFFFNGLPFVERLPQVHFEQFTTPVLDTNVFVEGHLDWGRFRRERGQTFPLNDTTLFNQTEFTDEVDRFDSEILFSYPHTLPGNITIKPWVGGRFTSYMDPSRAVDQGDGFREVNFDNEERAMFEGGVDISTRRTHEFDPWFDRFEKMRIVYEPILKYGYFNPSVDLEEIRAGNDVRFPFIDPVDAIRFRMHRISTLFQTRVEGKSANNVTSDFLTFSAGFEFDQLPDENLLIDNFEFFDDLAENDDHRFSDLVQNFEIFPYSWLSFGNNLRWDIDDSEVRSSRVFASYQPIERLRLNGGLTTFRFPSFGAENEKEFDINALYDVSSKWQMFVSGRFDVNDSELRRGRIGLLRDLYDFFARFEIEREDHPILGTDLSFSFTIDFWGPEGRQGQTPISAIF